MNQIHIVVCFVCDKYTLDDIKLLNSGNISGVTDCQKCKSKKTKLLATVILDDEGWNSEK